MNGVQYTDGVSSGYLPQPGLTSRDSMVQLPAPLAVPEASGTWEVAPAACWEAITAKV